MGPEIGTEHRHKSNQGPRLEFALMNRLGAASLIILLGLSPACDHPPRQADRLSELRPPLTIQNVKEFLDGGTVQGDLVDSHGSSYPFCFDGREWFSMDQAVPRHIFVGGHYPKEPTARPLPLWGKE